MKQSRGLVGVLSFLIAVAFFFLSGSDASAAIVMEATSSASNASGGATSLVISKPSVSTTGKILIANIVFDNGTGTTVTPPTGWNLIRRTNDGNKTGMATYWRKTTNSEPSTYTWSLSPSRTAVGGIVQYSGVWNDNPLDISGGSTGNSSSASAPAITTTVANERLIVFFATNASNVFGTASGGMTELFDLRNANASGPSVAGDEVLKSTAGFVATTTASVGSNHRWIGHIVALKPFPVEDTLSLCTDGIDNDLDGIVDLYDSNCEPFIPRFTLQSTAINDNGGTYGGDIVEADILVPNPATPIPDTAVQNTGFTDVYRTGPLNGPVTIKLNPGFYSFVRYYNLSGTDVGYTLSTSTNCETTIVAGESKTCTLTFNDIVPQLIVTKHVVNHSTGTAVASDFTISVNTTSGVSTSTFSGNESGTTVSFNTVGTYSVTETGPSGYFTTTSSGCSGSLVVGQVQTCVITSSDTSLEENTLAACTDGVDNDVDDTTDLYDTDCEPYIPRLTFQSTAINDNGGTYGGGIVEADILVPNPSTPIPGTVVQNTGFTNVYRTGALNGPITLKLNPGTYGFVRYYEYSGGDAGYTYTIPGCDGVISAGESKTCTLTFDDIPPQLTVIKHVVNNASGTASASDFTLSVSTSVSISTSTFPGDESGTVVTFQTPGTYSVSESGPSGYYTVASANCAGLISVGQTKTCIITDSDTELIENTLASCTDGIDNDVDNTTDLFDTDCESFVPRLTFNTSVTNNNGGGYGGDILQADLSIPNPSNPVPGTTVHNFPGVYRTSNGDPITIKINPGFFDFIRYYNFSGSDAGYTYSTPGCGTSIAAGESKTCTLAFDDMAPSLTLISQVTNDNSGTSTPSDWTLTATGPTTISGLSGVTTNTSFSAGTYTLSESGPSNYSSGSWSCVGDVTNSGNSITIAAGQSAVCTISHDDI